MRTTVSCVLLLSVLSVARLAARETGEAEITAVNATVYPGYARTRLTDGTFQPERYAFGEGGRAFAAGKDASVDEVPFLKIARMIAPGLARQNYVSSQDPEQTDLLIMVYWGATGTGERATNGYALRAAPITPPRPPPRIIVVGGRQRVYIPNTTPQPVGTQNSPDQSAYDAIAGAENRERDRENFKTAQLLGYDEDLALTATQPAGRRHLDLVDELEDARYFVILKAYDFRLMWKEKKPRLLWEVRYSIRSRGHLFDQSLAAMTGMAERYFGQASDGLVRKEVPLGDVKMADPDFKEYLAPAGKN
jgi:hypothetical protein